MTLPESTGTAGSAVPASAEAAPAEVAAVAAAPEGAPAKPTLARAERRERAVADALRTLVRDLHEAHFGPVAPQTPGVDLTLRLRATPSDGWALAFEPPLAGQVLSQIENLHAVLGVYRDGAVYCFKCLT